MAMISSSEVKGGKVRIWSLRTEVTSEHEKTRRVRGGFVGLRFEVSRSQIRSALRLQRPRSTKPPAMAGAVAAWCLGRRKALRED